MKKIGFLILVFLLSFGAGYSNSRIKVGYTNSAPYIYNDGEDRKGVMNLLWKEIEQDYDYETEWVFYDNKGELDKALLVDSIDVSLSPEVLNSELADDFDVSSPVLVSSIGVATVANFRYSSWFESILEILSFDFFKVIIFIGVIIFLFGFLMWIMEKRQNSNHFDNSRKGLVDSFWWSAVTMTTVGYGDKYPVTFGGRLVALVWMFMAMVIIASLTAGISSVLTVSNLSSGITKVEDLQSLNVGTIEASSSAEFLSGHIQPIDYKNLEHAFSDIEEEKIDAFVFDQPSMISLIKKKRLQDKLEVLPVSFSKEVQVLKYSPKFKGKKSLDVQLLKVTSSPYYDWVLAKEGLKR